MTRLWELFARLGQAVLEVAEAEVRALGDDLQGTGRRLLRFVLFLMAAVQLTVVAVALIGLAVARLLEGYLPLWLATLLPGVASLALAVGVAFWAWRGLSALEPPLVTVRRRMEDHGTWWREEIISAQQSEPADGGEDV